MSISFSDLGLIPELLDTVAELGYAEPTPIQAEAIPALLAGYDVMGQAQTGTGKTAAFALPMLNDLAPHGLQVLILAPTRELASQTAEAIYRYGNKLGVRVLPIYGGQPYERQVRRLEKGVQVVVGTPGRTLDLIRQKALDLRRVRYVVLDEADEMLKMGFIEDVEAILSATDAQTRQTTLFSATLPDEIRRLAHTYMHDPVLIAIQSEEMTVENVAQRYYVMRESDKIAALSRLLESEDLMNTLIFARTKAGAAELAETLIARGYPAEAIHGDLPQAERERILHRFREGRLTILVATDVVARGVDIPEVSHVINFDIPALAIEYVHRIGRTGRAGRGGDAITLITTNQRYHLRQIEAYTRKPITKAKLPTREAVLQRREDQFKTLITGQIESDDFETEYAVLDTLMKQGYAPHEIAAAAIKLLRRHEDARPLEDIRAPEEEARRKDKRDKVRTERNRDHKHERTNDRHREHGPSSHEAGMVRLYMDAGRSNGLRPADIVYSIASQSNIPGRSIGAITIRQYETYLDVPEAHVDAVLSAMKHGKIRGQSITLVRAEGLFASMGGD
jgi:ATP-dependent RNA helicase DeaD